VVQQIPYPRSRVVGPLKCGAGLARSAPGWGNHSQQKGKTVMQEAEELAQQVRSLAW